MDEQNEGSLRLLTQGEIKLARTVFENSIQYHKVWIHHDSSPPPPSVYKIKIPR
ncbi:hypothetical protein J2125_001152 [Erwinia toletana]|uniref:Uncharacterized protein n=1 Tax=Winslowiella toletana TaxID=92490 RepID=A0ABS4P5N9_9GAMM|nr:hypothetical protein [Winslowiella toletana]